MCEHHHGRLSRRHLLALPVAGAGLAMAAPPGWSDGEFIDSKTLVGRLDQAKAGKLLILHVGFNVLYRSKHIPYSLYVGPGNRQDGVEALTRAVAGKPKTTEIVIYCGCCPWSHCPNMRPAMDTLKALGYSRVKALMLGTNFSEDWIQLGYPVESGR